MRRSMSTSCASARTPRSAFAVRSTRSAPNPRRASSAVVEAAQLYKLGADDIVVLHDEIDLPAAKLRVKTGGGNAGHNGLRSITAHIGNDYRRVRIGVGRPADKDEVHNHVLSDFAKAERDWVAALCDIIADNAGMLVKGDDPGFQNKVHLAMQAKGFYDTKDEI